MNVFVCIYNLLNCCIIWQYQDAINVNLSDKMHDQVIFFFVLVHNSL